MPQSHHLVWDQVILVMPASSCITMPPVAVAADDEEYQPGASPSAALVAVGLADAAAVQAVCCSHSVSFYAMHACV